MSPGRPIAPYYGGKWRVAPQIIAVVPQHQIWVDAFSGLGSVTLRKPRVACEVINDLDGEVVNVFEQLRRNGPKLQRLIALTPYSRVEYERAFEPVFSPLERARRFIFRCVAGIGSNGGQHGFRTSLANDKYSAALSWANLPHALEQVVARLQGVIIENRPAIEIMRQFDREDTVHYVDPPYLGSVRRCTDGGYRHEMQSLQDHESLLLFLRSLRGRVLVSGYPSPLYDSLLGDWHCHTLRGARDRQNVARHEVLWANFKPQGGGSQ